MFRVLPLPAAVLAVALVSSCAGPEVENPTSFEIYVGKASTAPKYQIQTGDQLEVRFLHAPEQNVLLVVRPDGYVSLPLANEILAAGRTPEDLRLEITRAWAKEYREPEVSVVLRTAAAYKVHVGGHVRTPGVFELTGERNVVQAIFEAGGFMPSASPAHVIVIRPEGNGRFAVIPLDIEGVLSGRDTRQNLALLPRDAVYVPASAIADINTWVDQYIRQNIPLNLGLNLEF